MKTYQVEVVEKKLERKQYTINAKDKREALLKAEKGETEFECSLGSKEIIDRVVKVDTIKEVIKIDQDKYSEAARKIDKRVDDYISSVSETEIRVSYSAYKTIDDIPIDNLDEVAVEGKCFFVGHNYESKVVKSPTWLDVCVFANNYIQASSDFHHIFLEDVEVSEEIDGVKKVEFWMGS